MSDYMIRATAAGRFVRAFAVSSRGVTEYARRAHQLSPVASAALGRTMAAGLMMGAMMKNDTDVLTIQFRGDGPLGGMTVTATSRGTVKGYVNHPDVVLPPNAFGHFDVGGAVGKGILYVLRDTGLKEPYAGQVDIQTGEIAQDMAYYFAVSEQVPSIVALGVLMNKDNTVRESGGYIIQVMPGCPEEVIAALERKAVSCGSVTDMLRDGGTPETMLKALLEELDMEIMDKRPVAFQCDCSRERVTKALIALGRKELMNIISDGKDETLNCGFCNTDYIFTVDQMKEILKHCTH